MLKQDEEICHTVYQSSLKSILNSSQKKKIHAELITAETDKQNCLRRARRRFAIEIGNLEREYDNK